MNILVFDIETVPDTVAGARLYNLDGLSDEDIARAMTARRMQKSGSEFLPLHLHRIVAISVALRRGDDFKVWSLGGEESPEAELITRFYDGLARYTPTLVSWNGGGFDLPVLHYRALLHRVAAPRYWEIGEQDRAFRYDNYLNRFHWRHIDLMDVLAGFTPRAAAPLDEIAVMLGLPGKSGLSGADVWGAWLAGRRRAIRDYCEVDVVNTLLVYLHWEVVRGNLDAPQFDRECARVAAWLRQSGQRHLVEFAEAWEGGGTVDGGGDGDAGAGDGGDGAGDGDDSAGAGDGG